MIRLLKFVFIMVCMVVSMTACAPENLDITPSPTPTNTPAPTATRPPTNTPAPTATPDPNATEATEVAGETTEAETISSGEVNVDNLLAELPGQVPAGNLQFRRTGADTIYREVEGGRTGRIDYEDTGGSKAEIYVGAFDTPELAQAYYDETVERIDTLRDGEARDDLPVPNVFGQGTYGSEAVILRGNVFLRVSVPQFSSTGGNPLLPMTRAINAALDAMLDA